MNLIFENRPIKKNDAVTLNIKYKIGDRYGKFYIDSEVVSILGRIPLIVYVSSISADGQSCSIKIGRGNQGKKIDFVFPSEFFKIVKIPKMGDVVAWLYDNQQVVYPEQWRTFATEISSISRYIPRIFQTNLKAIYFVNKYCNHLYFSNDPYETLMYFKTIVQQLQLRYNERYNTFPNLSIRKSFIDAVQVIDKTWHKLDAISIYDMNNRNVFSESPYLSNKDRLDFYKDPKKETKNVDTKELREMLSEYDKKDLVKIDKNDSRFIHTLTQKVIDDLELVIFNVKSLPNRNQVVFIFIDKDNNKRFYIEDFKFIFYVSNVGKIIENDYIENFDETKHIPFVINNFEVLRNLKFAVNESYKKFMKKGKF